jgi:hypothetical protein
MNMSTQSKRMMLSAALAAICGTAASPAIAQDDWVDSTPYYEDDAWYDVSEWFDGNDYNPTDEAIGRWDNETFEYSSARTSTDVDNDYDVLEDYGYENGQNQDDDWFYDYYDDGYGFWDNNYYSIYSDLDDDGLYDSYAIYSDLDGDGFYEDVDYYTLNTEAGDPQEGEAQAQARQKQMRSNLFRVEGEVAATKTAKVRDRDHLIVRLQSENGQMVAVDMGTNASDAGAELSEGDQIAVTGHLVTIGEKRLLVAAQAELPNRTVQVERDGQKFAGTIEKTKQVEIRGKQHQFVKLNTEQGKTMMVDLGPADELEMSLEEGQNLTVQGVPAKVKERTVLMARKVMHDGQSEAIEQQLAASTRGQDSQ